WPRNPLEFTALQARFRTDAAIDLAAPPFRAHAARWEDLSDYAACLDLADAARHGGVMAIRYRSVRDPQRRANIALLSCRAFAGKRPAAYATWRLAVSRHGVNALCDRPEIRLSLPISVFAADRRLATLM